MNSFVMCSLHFMDKYRHHKFQVAILSVNHTQKQRQEKYMRTPTGKSVYLQRDYSDRVTANYNGETQSQGMGDRPNLGLEGILVRYYKDGLWQDGQPEIRDWHCFVADEKRQDARTSMANTMTLIDCASGTTV